MNQTNEQTPAPTPTPTPTPTQTKAGRPRTNKITQTYCIMPENHAFVENLREQMTEELGTNVSRSMAMDSILSKIRRQKEGANGE